MSLTLHGYFRSTASWRVRIALGLKGAAYDSLSHYLRRGEQNAPEFLKLNPQGFVPALALDDGRVLTQSLAICEYLDETLDGPALLPADAYERARVRAFAQAIACDIHPVQNLRVLARLRELGLEEAVVTEWARDVIDQGLAACDALLADAPAGRFCFGDDPSLADLCLIPQLGNARRFGVDLRWRRLLEIEAACAGLPAFRASRPEVQPDAD